MLVIGNEVIVSGPGADGRGAVFVYRREGEELTLTQTLDPPDGFAHFAPVGRLTANAFGLHDVIGNAAELCLDGVVARFYLRSPRLDPVAPWEGAERVFYRGGGWAFNALRARSAWRKDITPTTPSSMLGVRPARAIDP